MLAIVVGVVLETLFAAAFAGVGTIPLMVLGAVLTVTLLVLVQLEPSAS